LASLTTSFEPHTKIATDSISYMVLVVSLMRCGHIPFPISPRCSTAAINHLLSSTNATHLYASQDDAVQRLVSNARSEFHLDDLSVLPVYSFEDLWEEEPLSDAGNDKAPSCDLDGPALILHSSGKLFGFIEVERHLKDSATRTIGTTAFPKPVFISHRILVQRGHLACEFSCRVVVYTF
jgi:acyl-CoA synthetase (AMP-forming)/AMP-acid ligase II